MNKKNKFDAELKEMWSREVGAARIGAVEELLGEAGEVTARPALKARLMAIPDEQSRESLPFLIRYGSLAVIGLFVYVALSPVFQRLPVSQVDMQQAQQQQQIAENFDDNDSTLVLVSDLDDDILDDYEQMMEDVLWSI